VWEKVAGSRRPAKVKESRQAVVVAFFVDRSLRKTACSSPAADLVIAVDLSFAAGLDPAVVAAAGFDPSVAVVVAAADFDPSVAVVVAAADFDPSVAVVVAAADFDLAAAVAVVADFAVSASVLVGPVVAAFSFEAGRPCLEAPDHLETS